MATKKLKPKKVARRSPPHTELPVQAAVAVLKRHGIVLREVMLLKRRETARSCYLAYTGPRVGSRLDASNWTCVSEDGVRCPNGVECKAQTWTDKDGTQHLACCR